MRKRDKRSEAARIVIPDIVNPQRRERCLADPELFLKTYFPKKYTLPFGRHHYFMIDSIVSRARHGGKQAIAAPRGCGKTELVKGLNAYLIFAQLVRFLIPVGATTKLAGKIYQDFQRKVERNDLLLQDFPEVCHPVRELAGAPQRARFQHIDGKPTNLVWTSGDYLRLPDVPGSPYGGVKMAFAGLDAAFRGFNIDGDRPDFILPDDPETRESSKHIGQIEDREEILRDDIEGLVSQEENLTIVVLTTVQNAYCLSAKLTDPKQKPAYNGKRFGMIVKWPENKDLWLEYIAIRHACQVDGDEHGKKAVEFYLEHREAMDEGVEMLSDHFVKITVDGYEFVHSAIQQAYNKIADTSFEGYEKEYQNDPKAEEGPLTLGLTAGIVQSRVSGLRQNELPKIEGVKITVGLDIGKYFSHWVKVAWFGNATGVVIDYGVMETVGLHTGSTEEAIEIAILKALRNWRDEILDVNPPDLCMVDSGDYTDAVYEFVREVGKPFVAAKGWDTKRFRMGEESDTRLLFKECWASLLVEEGLWLYNVHTEWWKKWLQQRFVTHTFDDQQQFRDGSLSLFDSENRKEHLSFAQHVVAEEMQERFENNKIKREYVLVNKNNHWLDALALSCSGGGCLGVRLIKRMAEQMQRETEKQKELEKKMRARSRSGKSFLARRDER